MAHPIKYFPQAGATTQTAHEELEALLQTLHRTGALRVLDGLIGRFSEVSEVALEQLNEPAGRNALGNLAVLATALTASDPTRLERLMNGVTQGLGVLDKAMRKRPPGVFALLLRLHDADTRRGLYAIVGVLQAIGRELRPPAADGEREREQRVLKRGESEVAPALS